MLAREGPTSHGLTLPEAEAHDAGLQTWPSQNPGQSTGRHPWGPSPQKALRANLLGRPQSPESGGASVSTALCSSFRLQGENLLPGFFRVLEAACIPWHMALSSTLETSDGGWSLSHSTSP